MELVRLAMVVVMAAVGVGCADAQADRIESSKLTVLDRGAAPRFPIRYRVPEGDKQVVDMFADLEITVGGEVVVPRIVFVNEAEVTRVDPRTGAMDITMTTTDVRAEDRPGASLSAFEDMDLDEEIGVVTSWTLLSDGRSRNTRIKRPGGKRDASDRMTEQLFDNMTAILPEEPIGKGGRWRAEQVVRQNGIRATFETTYEVLAVSEKDAVLAVEQSVYAAPQDVDFDGVRVRLDKMVGSGNGTMHIDFDNLIDRVEVGMFLEMSASAMGDRVSMNMSLDAQVLPHGETPKDPGDVAPAP